MNFLINISIKMENNIVLITRDQITVTVPRDIIN